ncbi:MAG: phosphate acetyltransferase [Eubacteriales bacterium]|nr:phosphate acetyltransferase [Eubacteriales bacterium]
MTFIGEMVKRAKEDKKCIILPETGDRRVLEAACRAQKDGVVQVLLIGAEEKIKQSATDLDFTGIQFADPETDPDFPRYVERLVELRKHKGMTPEAAAEALKDYTSFGMILLEVGKADGLVAGAVNSTADTLRPALQILKTKAGTKLVSAFFMMVVPNCEHGANGTLLFADSGLNEDPDAEALSEIALSSAESFRLLVGEEPVIAMCSYSSHGSAKSHLTEKVIEATALAQKKAPELKLDGELQIDSALVPAVAKKKAPNSKVQGDANVLIFPNLDTGNIAYKLTQYLAKAEAYGPLLQGIRKPVNDLSRGCSADDIYGVMAITAVQALAAE